MEAKKKICMHKLIRQIKAYLTTHKMSVYRDIFDLRAYNKLYEKNAKTLKGIKCDPEVKIAIIIHLYYVDNWDLFNSALNRLAHKFDLFITLPAENLEFSEKIKQTHKNAIILEVPNRGRDVLPFLKTAYWIEKLGYEYVLKLHSKKSTHRTDGQDWLNDIVNKLLPENKKVASQITNLLTRKNIPLIGPKDQYLSLAVNFEANGLNITKIISRIYSPEVAHQILQVDRTQHGFFAGTMFWLRLDAVKPILEQNYGPRDFDREKGQIDGTFAHALERVFCLVPQIEKKDIYEAGSAGINKISYKGGNIPDWSNVYIGPKPK